MSTMYQTKAAYRREREFCIRMAKNNLRVAAELRRCPLHNHRRDVARALYRAAQFRKHASYYNRQIASIDEVIEALGE